MIAARMAWGNLFLHKAKSLLLGTIMCLGIAVLFVGNSLIDTAISGLRKMFVEGYTGDVMITGPTSFPTTIFGETAGDEEVLPHIAKFSEYVSLLKNDTRVSGTLPMLSGAVAMGLGEQVIGQGSAFGVDIADYREFFKDNISLVAGEWPVAGDDAWIVLSEISARMLSRSAGKEIGPGNRIILSALNDTAGTVIREVKVASVVRFNQTNQNLARISLVDADTMRDLLGFASLRDGPLTLTSDQQQFVNAFDPNSLFESGELFQPAGVSTTTIVQSVVANPVSTVEPDPAWQFLLLKLRKGESVPRFLADLTKIAIAIDEGDHAQDWVEGAGTVARTAQTVKLVFDLMVSIVAVIVIMITMNVLVVSISERVPEIGTLRALGAKKRFIRRMILLETSFLAVIAGIAGLALGYVILVIARKTGITAPNLYFEAIFAGTKLVPSISAGSALRAFLWIFGMSIFSSLYPIALALRIRPVVAMQGD